MLLLCLLCCAFLNALSHEFCHSLNFPYSCRERMEDVFFHSLYDFVRPSGFSLFVHQICFALSVCIPPKNFRILLHSQNADFDLYLKAKAFLSESSITFVEWDEEFDTIKAKKARIAVLQDVFRYDHFILQADSDEFPSRSAVVEAIGAIRQSSSCDAYLGILRERVSSTGQLINITLPIGQQGGKADYSLVSLFPYVCHLKKSVESAAVHKLVLYRAIYRPSVGNHKLVCSRPANALSYSECLSSIDKASYEHIREQISAETRPPKVCNRRREMAIDHYKYTSGVDFYLENRVKAFKQQGIPWYKESVSMLNYLKKHNNSICIHCPESRCHRSKERDVQTEQ